MSVNFYNPLNDLIQAAINLYPELNCYIQFAPVEDAKGVTIFPDHGHTAMICLDIKNNIIQCLDILCHEIAHVVLGESHTEHDKKWQEVQNNIYNEYERLVDMRVSACSDASLATSFLP